jgi:hypothetical protein
LLICKSADGDIGGEPQVQKLQINTQQSYDFLPKKSKSSFLSPRGATQRELLEREMRREQERIEKEKERLAKLELAAIAEEIREKERLERYATLFICQFCLIGLLFNWMDILFIL